MPYTPEQIAKIKATDPAILKQAFERMTQDQRLELKLALQGAVQPPKMIPSHYQEPQMIPSHVPGQAPPQTPEPEPETTAGGVIGAINRGLAPYAAGAAVGGGLGLFGGPLAPVSVPSGALLGMGTVGLTQAVGDPIVGAINSIFDTNFTKPTVAMEHLLTRLGFKDPANEAERIVYNATQTAAGAAGGAALGRTMLRGQSLLQQANPTRTQAIARMLADQPTSQIVGGAGAGAASQATAEAGGGAPAQFAAGLAGSMAAGAPFIRTPPKVQSTIGAAERAAMAMPERQPIQTLADIVENTKRPGAVGEQARRDLSQLATVSKEAEDALKQITVGEAEKANVRVFTSDVRPPKSFAGKMLESVREKTPIFGTGSGRAAQQEERIELAKEVIRDLGASDVAEASAGVFENLVARRASQFSKYSKMKKDVIERFNPSDPRVAAEFGPGVTKVKVPVPSATAAIDVQIAKLKGMKNKEMNTVIDQLENWKTSITGQDIPTIELNRAQIGESFTAIDKTGVRSIAEKALNDIYPHLNEDMGNFIKATGERRDYTKWRIANHQLSQMMGEVKAGTLRAVLKRGDTKPTVVKQLLFSQDPTEVKQLMHSLTPEGVKHAKVAMISQVAEDMGGIENISPERFVTAVRKRGGPIGIVFDSSELDRLSSAVRILKLTQRASEAVRVPSTGVQAVPFVGFATLSQMLGVPGAIGATVGIGGMARAYESAPVRNLLMRMGKTKPGSIEEATIARQVLNAMRAEQSAKEEKQ